MSLLYPGQSSRRAGSAPAESDRAFTSAKAAAATSRALLERVIKRRSPCVAWPRSARSGIRAGQPDARRPPGSAWQRRVLAAARANGDIESSRAAQTLDQKSSNSTPTPNSGLGFWRGSLEVLPGLELPSEETIDRFGRELSDGERRERA